MSSFIESLEQEGFAGRVLTDKQVSRVIGGSNASRYGRVSRALQDGSLVQIKRGLYTFGDRSSSQLPHPFSIAQSLLPGSYVSFETALSYHGWIPEAVYAVSCVTPGRKSLNFKTDRFGSFSYEPIALERYMYLVGVQRVSFGNSAVLVATPLRALMDLVARRKLAWRGLSWIMHGLRVDEAQLRTLKRSDFAALRPVYKHKQARAYLAEFERAWASMKPAKKDKLDD